MAHTLEEHNPGGPAGSDCWKPDSHRGHRKNGEYWHAACICHRVHRSACAPTHESRPAAAISYSVGTSGAASGYFVQWLHDVQTWLGQLGAVDYLARHRNGCVLYL